MTIEQIVVLAGMLTGTLLWAGMVVHLILGEPFGAVPVIYFHGALAVAVISMLRGKIILKKMSSN